MTATPTRGRPSPRPSAATAALTPPPAPPAAHPAPDLAPVLAALTRTIQATLACVAGAIGRGDMGANAALVRLRAHPDDVETLRAFLAAQPRPAHIPEEF